MGHRKVGPIDAILSHQKPARASFEHAMQTVAARHLTQHVHVGLCQSLSAYGMLVLPMMIAPAALRRATATASSLDRETSNIGMPQVIAIPTTLIGFFDRHRDAQQGAPLASGQSGVRRDGRRARANEVPQNDRVNGWVKVIDPRKRAL
jgi:hypothetical protein